MLLQMYAGCRPATCVVPCFTFVPSFKLTALSHVAKYAMSVACWCVQFGLGAPYVLQSDLEFLNGLGEDFPAGE
jgi:hypothetical protein